MHGAPNTFDTDIFTTFAAVYVVLLDHSVVHFSLSQMMFMTAPFILPDTLYLRFRRCNVNERDVVFV